jgi:hypothetical protein
MTVPSLCVLNFLTATLSDVVWVNPEVYKKRDSLSGLAEDLVFASPRDEPIRHKRR